MLFTVLVIKSERFIPDVLGVKMKKAILDIGHAGCWSCKIAIEHAGKRIDKIKEIELDIGTHRINMVYEDEENGETVQRLQSIVERLGYEAGLVETYDID